MSYPCFLFDITFDDNTTSEFWSREVSSTHALIVLLDRLADRESDLSTAVRAHGDILSIVCKRLPYMTLPGPRNKADLTFYEAAQPIVDAYNNFSLALLDLAKPLLLALTSVAERFVNTVERRQITIKRPKIEPPHLLRNERHRSR